MTESGPAGARPFRRGLAPTLASPSSESSGKNQSASSKFSSRSEVRNLVEELDIRVQVQIFKFNTAFRAHRDWAAITWHASDAGA